MKHMTKLMLFAVGMLLALICLHGCFPWETAPGPGNQLRVAVNPSSGYPPLDVTITADGVTEGQYTFVVEGHTSTQGSNIKRVTLHLLPCEGEVIWERPGYVTQRVTFRVTLDNESPIIGIPRLNGLADLWYLHPRKRYIVDFPDARDPDGGPVTLVDVHVQNAWKLREDLGEDTVFCPPYEGQGVYHAFDRNRRLIENAFVFHCTWTGPPDTALNIYPLWDKTITYKKGAKVNRNGKAWECLKNNTLGGKDWLEHWKKIGDVKYGTNLPFSPPGYGESGYPGSGTNCPPIEWSKDRTPATMTTITATFRDEHGIETTESWDLPTGPDPGCNIY